MRRVFIVGGAAALLIGAAGMFGAWTVFRADAPAPASLADALRQVPQPVATSPAVEAPSLALVAGSGNAPVDLTGRYQTVGGPSFVGYRVKERLAGAGSNVAVGRSGDVSGSFAFDGRLISDLDVTVDLQALQSDDARRDLQLRTQAIESARYPSARFVVTAPFSIGAVPSEGEETHLVLVGDLTLRGVTRPVTAHVYGALKGEHAVVVGTAEILFSDFGIQPPRSIVVVSVEDHATVEFQLIFKKA